MRVLLTALISVGLIGPAAAGNEKLCILSAAQKLPNIPGLTILDGRTKDIPKELKRAGPDTLIVEIDVKAVNQTATFSFVCASAPGKPAMIESLGLS